MTLCIDNSFWSILGDAWDSCVHAYLLERAAWL